jgi:hypothetical protein
VRLEFCTPTLNSDPNEPLITGVPCARHASPTAAPYRSGASGCGVCRRQTVRWRQLPPLRAHRPRTCVTATVIGGRAWCMACLCVWPACVYGLHVGMACLCVWPVCAYGLAVSLCMACLCVWPVCGVLVYGLPVYGFSVRPDGCGVRPVCSARFTAFAPWGPMRAQSLRARQAPAPRA